MNKHAFLKAIGLLSLVVLIGASSVSALAQIQQKVQTPQPTLATLIVDDEGDGDYTTISDAIAAASEGDTIEVYSGTYVENIEIDLEITLTGMDTEYLTGTDTGKPVIDGDAADDVITIYTQGNNDPVTITGFIIQNSGPRDSGIFVDFSIDVDILENEFIENHHGVYVYHSCTTIEENVFALNDWGILTEFSDHCIITQNVFDDNTVGFQLESSHAVSIERNDFVNNTEGLLLVRSPVNDITFNNFESNDRHAWFKNCWNKWNDNYWSDRPGIIPFYVIFGELQFSVFPALRIPIPQFDFRAKSTPN